MISEEPRRQATVVLFYINHVYCINRLEDLVSLMVDVHKTGLPRGKFYLLAVDCNPGVPG